jgi:acyl transferase domain-containing protein/phosphopantetheinyl transferase
MAEPIEVAIVGMAAVFPGAPDAPTYWRNIVGRLDAISAVPEGRLDPAYHDPEGWRSPASDRIYAWRGGFVDDPAAFDPLRFGMMPMAVPHAEPDQLMALQIAADAIEDAGGAARLPDRDRVGVVLGRGGYLGAGVVRLEQRVRTARQLVAVLEQLLPEVERERLEEVRRAFTDQLGPEQPEAAIGLVPNLAASRIANRLDLCGPAYTVDAACASSLIAVDHAVRELSSGRCDLVLAGGVHHSHDITLWSVFSQLRALSPSECIRPFSRHADGVLIGEGTGVVVLKRLDDALRDGDRVYAVVRGTGVAGDGRATTLMAPQSGGQVLAIRQAWQAAGLDPQAPGAVGLIEAHGTATPAGDDAELSTLQEVFGEDPAAGIIGLGSVKSMIGHAMPAAGVAGLIKAAFAVHHAVLPPTLHAEEPHPALTDSRLRLIGSAVPWEGGRPRRAGVNAFGFGGINAHVVLEQAPIGSWSAALPAPGAPRVRTSSGPEGRILRLAADSLGELARLLDTPDELLISGTHREPVGRCRLAVLDPNLRRLGLARKAVLRGTSWRGRNDIWFTPAPLLADPTHQLAFVFPGIEAAFDPWMEDIAQHFGLPCPLPVDGSLEQQAVGVARLGFLLRTALAELGIRPDVLAGHSVGEWTAMGAAETTPPESFDAFLADLASQDFDLPDVVFAALGCGVKQALAAMAGLPAADRARVGLSHDNCPHQSIVCGVEQVVDRLLVGLAEQQVMGQILPFRSGFHTPLLRPYLDPMTAMLNAADLHPPKLPIWSATTASRYPTGLPELRELIVRHLVEPVRFGPMIERMYDSGVRVFVQMGLGSTMGFVGDTLHRREHLAVSAQAPKVSGMEQLARVVAALWTEGAEPDFDRLHVPARRIPAADTAANPVAAPSCQGVRLGLGVPMLRLPAGTAPLRAVPAALPEPARMLAEVGHPLLAELESVLQEASGTARGVLEAWQARGSVLRQGSGPQLRRRPEEPHALPVVMPATRNVTRLTVSIEAMPYLKDHCLYRQRNGWGDLSDRFPVVPMTTMLEIMMDAARSLVPGRTVVGIESVRALQWLAAIPSVEVSITSVRDGQDRVRVSLDGYSYGIVLLGDGYPTAPSPSDEALVRENPSDVSADRFYADRWMFHGPRYQGLAGLGPMAENGMRATVTTLPAPGALLDNAGQVTGYWLQRNAESNLVAFPSSIGRITFHGPHPLPGARLECTLWARTLTERAIRADLELVTGDGQVWARIDDWVDYRFYSDDLIWPVWQFPEVNCLAREQRGGWFLVKETWDPSARDMLMRRYLTAAERTEYEKRNPRARSQWLLGRMAVKDAVRRLLWQQGAGPIYPAEITVVPDSAGRPFAHGPFPEPLPVSVSHTAGYGAAMVLPPEGEGGVGIDVEKIEERESLFESATLTANERLLLDLVAAAGDRAGWLTRFWAAKEAVSKAVGTGLRGRPQDFVVVRAEESGRLQVDHRSRGFQISTTVLEGGGHVAAWVRGRALPWTAEPEPYAAAWAQPEVTDLESKKQIQRTQEGAT